MAIVGQNINATNIEEENQRLGDMLSSINAYNKDLTAQEERERAQKELEEQAKRREERAAIAQEFYKERFEREEAARIQREKEEREREEEEERIRKKNPFYNTMKKISDTKKENEDEEKENYLQNMAYNVLDKTGDTYRQAREWAIMKKRMVANKAIHVLANTIGFAIPELPEDLEAEEARIAEKKAIAKERREEKKAIAKEKAEENKVLREEKKAEKKQQAEEKKQKKEAAKQEKSSAKTTKQQKQTPSPSPKKTNQAPSEEVQNEPVRSESQTRRPDPGTPKKQQTEVPEPPVQKSAENLSDEEWNERLDKDVRMLKEEIITNHETPMYMVIERAVNDIQGLPVIAVLVASKDMNDLFIFSRKDDFLSVAINGMNYQMDFSYIYVITPTASQYYGADTCYQELTILFDNIRQIIIKRRFLDENMIKQIPGINMFRRISMR